MFRGSYQFPRNGQNVQGGEEGRKGDASNANSVCAPEGGGGGEQICSALSQIQVPSQV